jgi:hypothetical protein
MEKKIKLTESDLNRLVRKVIYEQGAATQSSGIQQRFDQRRAQQDSRAQNRASEAPPQLNQSQLATMQQNLIKQFQQMNGLRVTGKVDKMTYDSMVKKGVLPNIPTASPTKAPQPLATSSGPTLPSTQRTGQQGGRPAGQSKRGPAAPFR